MIAQTTNEQTKNETQDPPVCGLQETKFTCKACVAPKCRMESERPCKWNPEEGRGNTIIPGKINSK